jgi:hypothetical protein
MAGQAQLSFQTPATVLGNASGGLRGPPSRGFTLRRSQFLTFAQAGLPGFDVGLWFGLLAHGATPSASWDRVAAEGCIAMPDFSARRSRRRGWKCFFSTPDKGTVPPAVPSPEKFARIGGRPRASSRNDMKLLP